MVSVMCTCFEWFLHKLFCGTRAKKKYVYVGERDGRRKKEGGDKGGEEDSMKQVVCHNEVSMQKKDQGSSHSSM